MEVNRASSEPPYRQIARQLAAAIADGTWPPGSRLPGVIPIMQETGVAALTARKALHVLVGEGLAYIQPGMGTYVAPREEWPER